jgi:integrase
MAKVTASGSSFSNRRLTEQGLVSIEEYQGRLRLRFRHEGKRCTISVGLPDSAVNRRVAQQRAAQIELDIASGNFDFTLKKYKPAKGDRVKDTAQVGNLFEQFMALKVENKVLGQGSLARYKAVLKHLRNFFKDALVEAVNQREAQAFVSYLRNEVSEQTIQDYLIVVQACWVWAETETLAENPWRPILKQLKPAPKQKVKPFTSDEVHRILEGFRNDAYYQHYADFVAFLFGTGCRFGEAAALKWQHCANDFSTVWIGESVSRGVRKSTKTGKARTAMLTSKITQMLAERKSESCTPDDLVFPAPKGDAISDLNFRRRAWKNMLGKLGIDYRKPYATRHTAISHALANGANPLAVAEQTGHDPQILFKHYASAIQKAAVMVEF